MRGEVEEIARQVFLTTLIPLTFTVPVHIQVVEEGDSIVRSISGVCKGLGLGSV